MPRVKSNVVRLKRKKQIMKAAVVVMGVAVLVNTGESAGVFDKAEYAARRAQLMEKIGDGAAVQAGGTFPPNDDCRLAELVDELTADDMRMQAMAHNGPEFIKKHYAAQDMRLRMERVLEGAAGLTGSSDSFCSN